MRGIVLASALFLFCQQGDGFYVCCAWEHVYWGNVDGLVAEGLEAGAVTGEGGWVTGHVDNTVRGHGSHGGDQGLIHALARGVNEDDIRLDVVLFQFVCHFGCVPAEELGVGNVVVFCVFLSVLNGFRNNFHANEFGYFVCHGEANGAGAAVEVQQEFFAGEAGFFLGLLV